MEKLVDISRYYGKNSDYVIAGGGNTSFKDAETLYVKGSGTALADASPETFVRMDRKALAKMWEKSYPRESAEREKVVLSDLLAARMPGEGQKRPSVETMLHDLLPYDYVVHTHPALVNGLTCSQQGESAMKELFGEEAIWIPSTNPGYVLSLTVKKALEEYMRAKHGKAVSIIFLQNHGVFAGSDSTEGIKAIYRDIVKKIEAKIKRRPDFSAETSAAPAAYTAVLAKLSGGHVAFLCNNEISRLVKDRASFHPVSSAFSPDHIVYAGSDPLFYENGGASPGSTASPGSASLDEAALQKAWKSHTEKTGLQPKIVAVRNVGIFGLGSTEKATGLAIELFTDAIKVAVYSASFGGPLFMSREQIDFINGWEVEAFRSKVSMK